MSSNNKILENNDNNNNDDNIEIDGDEIIAMSSTSSDDNDDNDNNDELKLDHLPTSPKDKTSKARNTLSFNSLPSENSIYGGYSYEFQSDLLDSLRVLSISLQQELDIIIKYFPGLQYQPYENNILFERSSVQTIEIKYQITNETIPEHLLSEYQVELILNIINTYPKQENSCNCRAVNCAILSRQECQSLKDRLNDISQQHTKNGHNGLIMMMIYIDNKMSSLNKNTMPLLIKDESSTLHSAFKSSSASSSVGNIVGNIGGNIGGNNINQNGFFDSLNSLHIKDKDEDNKNKQKQAKILPGSFSSFQDVLTTQTRDERKVEEKYAAIDEQLPAPKMCGAIWGRNGELIFFNNIIRKRPKNGKKLEIKQERDGIKSFQDYNKFIENRGANHIHSDELQSVRKRVFANHLDEDEDRFGDEFVVGFSLSHQHSQQHQTKINKGINKYYPYRNAYHHRSVSFLHQQHHKHNIHQQQHHHHRNNYLRMYHHTDTQHHIMPHLVLPSSHHHHQQSHHQQSHHPQNDISIKSKTKRRHKFQRKKYHLVNGRNGHNKHPPIIRHGNAKIFCPAIIKFIITTPIINFSIELISKCKLKVNDEYNVSKLCKYNAKICKELGLNRLYKTFETLSTFLQTANKSNTLIPSPYHCNYMAKFVKKVVDELYLNNEIQGIAIIACLLRQSQYFPLLFHQNNCFGYLLQSCLIQYLRVIKDRIHSDSINDIEELEQFTFLLNQQKQMFQFKDDV